MEVRNEPLLKTAEDLIPKWGKGRIHLSKTAPNMRGDHRGTIYNKATGHLATRHQGSFTLRSQYLLHKDSLDSRLLIPMLGIWAFSTGGLVRWDCSGDARATGRMLTEVINR